jgi:hypothetical protein
VRTQLARLRIDDLEFFFDAESEDVVFCAHRSSNLKPNCQASILLRRPVVTFHKKATAADRLELQ